MYATVKAMLEKFSERELIQLTDNEEPYQNMINYDRLNAALEEANSEVDGYLARFTLPLQTIPPYLKNAACNMARYHACTGAMSENDPIKIKYTAAIKTLKDIAKGEVGLGGSPAGESNPIETSANNVMFTVARRDFGNGGW